MTNQRIPILPIVRQAYGFMSDQWRTIVQIAWLPVAIVCLSSVWMVTYLPNENLASLDANMAARAMMPFAITNVVSTVLFFLTCVMIYAGILQLFFKGVRPTRPFYFRWDRDEWRIAGASIAQTVILAGFTLAAIFGISIAFTIILLIAVAFGTDISFLTQVAESGSLEAMVSHPLSAAMLVIFSVVFLLGFIWVGVKMWLFVPHAYEEGRVALRQAWRISKGHVSRLLGVFIVTALPLYLAGTIVIAFLDASVLNRAFAEFTMITAWSPGLTAAPEVNPHDRLGAYMIVAALGQIFRSTLVIAVICAQASTYQWLRAGSDGQNQRDGEDTQGRI